MTDRHKEQDPTTLSEHAKKSLGAYKWNLYDQTLSQLLNFGINILLLRLLSPDDFGVFVIPFAVISFIVLIQDFGYSSLLVFAKKVDKLLINSIFWVNILTSVLIFLGIQLYLITPLSQTNEPLTNQLLFWLSFGVPLSGIYYVPEALLRKKLFFKPLFIVGITAIALSGLAGLLAAYAGWGAQALGIKYVVYLLILAVGYMSQADWKPELQLSFPALKPHWRYHIPLSTEQALNFIHRNIDGVLISKFLGITSAGLYDRAYRILMFPIQQVSGSFARVMLPSLSAINQDPDKVGKYYFFICRMVIFVILPTMILFGFHAETFVLLVFGDQWLEIVPLAQIFAVIAVFQSLGTLSGSIYQAMGVTGLMLKLGAVLKMNSVLAICIGVFYFKSITAVALCYAIASIINSLPHFHFTSKIVNSSFGAFIKNIAPFMWASAPLVVLNIVLPHVVETPILCTVLATILSAVVYMGILSLFFNSKISEIKTLVQQWIQSK